MILRVAAQVGHVGEQNRVGSAAERGPQCL
jgi:hypothetical protein